MEKCMSKFCGYALKDKTARAALEKVNAEKLNKYQGAENKGKILVVNSAGKIEPTNI